MAVFKCKMCGGTIEFEPDYTVGVCDSCGTRQTLPHLDNDRRANLYDRANHFRRNNDYDKAAGIYEQILVEDNTDAEAYWSLVLCHYGIEYVEDPATHKRIPTVNRAQFTSIFDDDNYRSALEYADALQRSIYEQEATRINEIQKGILAISQKEEPFDVFICYKETDAQGRRTRDSVLATELYHQLTQEGFKVFFSRITLEDKLGIAYEPYIFAALNSSKVMVVLGTKPENFNAIWVRNEWSRYLSLVRRSGGKKVLIPAYRDMDPYDLPDEFSHLQAQDMSKLGFMQDLVRGIKKIVKTDTPKAQAKEAVVINKGDANTAPLLRRAFLFLEDGEWEKADDFCEQVLNMEPENAEAYIGKLMAELKVHKQEELADFSEPFDSNNNYQKAIRFGDEILVSKLKGYIEHISERKKNEYLSSLYDKAVDYMNNAATEEDYKEAAQLFNNISGFKDTDTVAERCLEKAEECRIKRLTEIYDRLLEAMHNADSESVFITIANAFGMISGFKDSDELREKCFELANECVLNSSYDNALSNMKSAETIEDYQVAEQLLSNFAGFKDADASIIYCQNKIEELKDELYNSGVACMANDTLSDYKKAIDIFSGISDWRDVDKKIEECKEKISDNRMLLNEIEKRNEEARDKILEKNDGCEGCLVCFLIGMCLMILIAVLLAVFSS